MQPKYIRDLQKIKKIVYGGIERLLKTDEGSTTIRAVGGSDYVLPTGVFNSLRGYMKDNNEIGSKTALDIGQSLTIRTKKNDDLGYYKKISAAA